MGMVHADIELINEGDREMARRNIIGEEEMPARLPTMLPVEECGGDVLIHPQRQELIVNPEHPNLAVLKIK